jgi:hypothetical protein
MNLKFLNLTVIIIVIFLGKIDLILSDCSYEHGIDYKENDLNFIFASSPQDCCNQCQKITDCKAWTYVSLTRICWIKNQLGTKSYSLGSKNIKEFQLKIN